MEPFNVFISFIVVLLSSLITCRFLILFSSAHNSTKYYVFYTTAMILIDYILFCTEFFVPQVMNELISILISFAFSRFILKSQFGIALLCSMLNGVIFGIYNIAGFAVSGILYRETQINGYSIMLLISITILILSAVTLETFIKRYGKHSTWKLKHSVLSICPLAFIYFVTQVLINIAYNPVDVINHRLHYNTDTTQDLEVLFVSGISLISIYVILYFYEKAMEKISTQNKMIALEAYTEMQKQYINEAKQKYENTKAFRHDMQNHMITLAGLAKNNESEKVKEYLKRFDNEVKKLAFDVFTGNAVIDVLLKEKLGFAKEQGIKVRCDASIPKDFMIDDFDLCIIFFNALDNAIKGCEYAEEKLIDIVAKKNKDFFIIDIMNHFHPEKYEKGLGIGLEAIKFISEKYRGCLEISTNKEIFRVSILFSLKLNAEQAVPCFKNETC